ncbi:MAG: UPF0280 family protein [Elusimicrobiota bacterium]|nr:UPF0280 family protein [Elusimicrobiota bacterium]MDH5661542.1 UPF0280 family protein [Elusimicrobiota bacterium]
MVEIRKYRELFKSKELVSFRVKQKETDIYVAIDLKGKKKLKSIIVKTEQLVRDYRRDIEDYIKNYPIFEVSFKPVAVDSNAPEIIIQMAQAALLANVGPFASVAGAIAGAVGGKLSEEISDVIIENGGDVFIKTTKTRKVGIYYGAGDISHGLGLEIDPADGPLGICASSGTCGHSFSFGRADVAVAVSGSTALADACATAMGNLVKESTDIAKGINFARAIEGIKGVVIVKGSQFGFWGDLRIISI